IAVLPSDHYIGDEAECARVVGRAYDFAAGHDELVTIGVEPTEPTSEYGYLRLGGEIEPGIVRLQQFVEKPPRERAEEFIRAGNYAWNAGMFVWQARVFRRALEQTAPEIAPLSPAPYPSPP